MAAQSKKKEERAYIYIYYSISHFLHNIIFFSCPRNWLSCPGGVGNSARKGETTRVGLRDPGLVVFSCFLFFCIIYVFACEVHEERFHQSYCRALGTEGGYRGYANFQDEEKANQYLDQSAF